MVSNKNKRKKRRASDKHGKPAVGFAGERSANPEGAGEPSLGGFVSAQRRQSRSQREVTLRANRLLLMNPDGEVRAAFAANDDATTLAIFDPDGELRFSINVAAGGESTLTFYGDPKSADEGGGSINSGARDASASQKDVGTQSPGRDERPVGSLERKSPVRRLRLACLRRPGDGAAGLTIPRLSLYDSNEFPVVAMAAAEGSGVVTISDGGTRQTVWSVNSIYGALSHLNDATGSYIAAAHGPRTLNWSAEALWNAERLLWKVKTGQAWRDGTYATEIIMGLQPLSVELSVD